MIIDHSLHIFSPIADNKLGVLIRGSVSRGSLTTSENTCPWSQGSTSDVSVVEK